MKKDLDVITTWENGTPFDKWGYALDPAALYDTYKKPTVDINKAVYSKQATDPLSSMEYVIGTIIDHIAFDFCLLPNHMAALHAVFKSETSGFIEDYSYQLVYMEDAPDVALGIIDNIIEEWILEQEIDHDEIFWNQDVFYFYRAVSKACGRENPEWKSLRFGVIK